MNVLIVACHPDDEVLGCGGAIRKHFESGDTVKILLLTGGATGRYNQAQADGLKQGAHEAAKILGASVELVELPNQSLDAVPLSRVIEPIEAVIANFRPERVYMHHEGDLNKDHEIAARATATATRPLPDSPVREVFSFFVPSSTEWNAMDTSHAFLPNVYLDISSVIKFKLKAMKCYPTEIRPFPHPRSIQALVVYARKFGIEAGVEAGEPFRLLRKVSALP